MVKLQNLKSRNVSKSHRINSSLSKTASCPIALWEKNSNNNNELQQKFSLTITNWAAPNLWSAVNSFRQTKLNSNIHDHCFLQYYIYTMYRWIILKGNCSLYNRVSELLEHHFGLLFEIHRRHHKFSWLHGQKCWPKDPVKQHYTAVMCMRENNVTNAHYLKLLERGRSKAEQVNDIILSHLKSTQTDWLHRITILYFYSCGFWAVDAQHSNI